MDFYEAYNFLRYHPIACKDYCSYIEKNLWIDVVKVNPATSKIDDDKTKNTNVEVWLEFGPIEFYDDVAVPKAYTHDIDLDCGGDTFEEAICELAKLVKEKYGDYDHDELY